MYGNQNQYDNFINAINIAAFLLGYENLQENRQQSAYNDVHAANDQQAQYLLDEIDRRFQEQNKILEKQNEILDIIIKLLEVNQNE